MFCTHVSSFNQFVKVYGQKNQSEGIGIETAIQDLRPGIKIPQCVDDVPPKSFCFAKYSDDQYYRCKVLSHVLQKSVLVHFLDYGNTEILPIDRVGIMEDNPKFQRLMEIRPQAQEFILAGIYSTHWRESELDVIRNEITNDTVSYSAVGEFGGLSLITIKRDTVNLTDLLVNTHKIGSAISLHAQEDKLARQNESKVSVPAFTSNILNASSENDVICSNIHDGPFLFSVQLESQKEELQKLTAKLKQIELLELTQSPVVGMACVAHSEKIESVQRAMITHVATSACAVRFVDYGHQEVVEIHQLYEIPGDLLKIKLLAVRSTLSGFKYLDRTNQVVRLKFAELVQKPTSPLRMKIVPLEGNPTVHYCELFLNESNVYDELSKAQRKSMTFGENEPLMSSSVLRVFICQATSPSRFYVQYYHKIENLEKFKNDINSYFQAEKIPSNMTEIRIGAICAVKLENDWHRTEITDIRKSADNSRSVALICVDSGKEVEVNISNLKRLNYQLAQVPPFAIECSLHGAAEMDSSRFKKCLNLTKNPDRMFKIKIHNRLTFKSYLVDLMDDNQTIVINDLLKSSSSDLNLDQYYQKPATNGTTLSRDLNGNSTNNSIQELEAKKPHPVTISWWSSPMEFYCQLQSNQTSLAALMEAIKYCQKTPIPPSSGKLEELVIVKYHKDSTFYRSQIEDYNSTLDKYKVQFVDYGTKAIVNSSQMFLFDEEFIRKSRKIAIKCCLYSSDKILASDTPQERVTTMIRDAKAISCDLVDVHEGLHRVVISIDEVDMLYKMIKENLLEVEKQKNTKSVRSGPEVVKEDLNFKLLVGQNVWIKVISLDGNAFKFHVKDFEAHILCGSSNLSLQKADFIPVYVLRVTEDLYEVEPSDCRLLPEPIVEDRLTVTVSAGPKKAINRLYVQRITSLRQITQLHIELCEVCENISTVLSMDELKAQGVVAIKSSDGFWYRGQLISGLEKDSLTFLLVDYGREETVDLKTVRWLPPKYQTLKKLAISCYIPFEKFSDRVPHETICAEVSSLTKEMAVILHVIELYRGHLIADVVSNGFHIDHALQDLKYAIRCDLAKVRNQIDAEMGKAVKTVSVNKEAVEISHFDNPERVFVQLKRDLGNLRQMQENLQIVAPSMKNVMISKVGQLCVARNSFDGVWYRAKVLDYAPDITTVQFIDYGYTDVITERQNQVKEMMPEFEKFEQFARFCSLAMRPEDNRTEWDEKVLEIFNNIMIKSITECQFLTKSKSEKYYVKLFIDGEDMDTILLRHKVGVKFDLIMSESVCYVCHINSLSDFYIQLERDGKALDLLAKYFKNSDDFPNLTKDEMKIGQICGAQFPDDDLWYRARIVSKPTSEPAIDVQFIDFGNITEVKRLKRISKEVENLPVLAKKCRLEMPKSVLNFSAEAEKRFHDVAQMGATVMRVDLVSMERDVAVVELFRVDNGRNVFDELIKSAF